MSRRYEEYEEGGWDGRQRTITHQGRVPPLRHLAEDAVHDKKRRDARLTHERRGGYGLQKQPIDVNKVFPHITTIMNDETEGGNRALLRRIQ